MTDFDGTPPAAEGNGAVLNPSLTLGHGLDLTSVVASGEGTGHDPYLYYYPIILIKNSSDVVLGEIYFPSVYAGREMEAQALTVLNQHLEAWDVTFTPLIGTTGSELDTINSTYLSLDDTSYILEEITFNVDDEDTTTFYIKWHPPSTAKIGDKDWKLRVDVDGWTPPAVSGWTHYGRFTIQGSSDGALTDYQVEQVIYYGGQMNTDFSDIRFYLADGTALTHAVVTKTDSDYAIFSVKIPTIPSSPGSVDVYVFSGNSAATTLSDPSNTFLFFDDATGTYSDKWESGGDYTTYDSRSCLHLSNTYGFSNKVSITRPCKVEFDFYITDNVFIMYCQDSSANVYESYHVLVNIDGTYYWRRDYGTMKSGGNNNYQTGWNTFKLLHKATGAQSFIINGIVVPVSLTDTVYNTGYLGFGCFSFGTQHAYIHNLRVSKYTTNPPVVGDFYGWNLTDNILEVTGKVLYQSQDLPGFTPVVSYSMRVDGALYE